MYFPESEWDMEFITQQDFIEHVNNTFMNMMEKKSRISTLKEFNANKIDAVKLTFDTFLNGLNKRELITSELIRQIDKSVTNDIGKFHQDIFNYIKGWHVPQKGFDIENEEKGIYVELKNKHNTMNSSSSQKTYMNLQHKLLRDANATCMLVEIIAKKSQNIPWKVSVDGEQFNHDKIRRVSIDKFYGIATGDELAFKKVCAWLPIVIKRLADEIQAATQDIKILYELSEKSDFFLKSLYMMTFESYNDFDDLQFKYKDELERTGLF